MKTSLLIANGDSDASGTLTNCESDCSQNRTKLTSNQSEDCLIKNSLNYSDSDKSHWNMQKFDVNEFEDEEKFVYKKNLPKSYYIFKEFMMTERTAVFDLKILAQNFQRLFLKHTLMSTRTFSELFSTIQPLYVFHRDLLNDLEIKMKNWENSQIIANGCFGSDHFRTGELFLCSVHNALHYHRDLIQQAPIFLAAIDELNRTNKSFCNSYRSMQDEDYCYLPINCLFLKAVFRMILGRIVAAFLEEGGDSDGTTQLSSSRVALEKIASFNRESKIIRESLVNFVKMVELQSYLTEVEGLIHPKRKFVREGWIFKWTKRGLIPHILILFNDSILFAHRSSSGFSVDGIHDLRGMTITDGDLFHLTSDPTTCITIHAYNQPIILSANSTNSKEIWKEELSNMIEQVKKCKIEQLPKSITTSSFAKSDDTGFYEDFVDSRKNSSTNNVAIEQENVARKKRNSKTNVSQICWYRQSTLMMSSLIKAPINQISGYLLRKLRTSTGWQKLWVVHANFTLFFYKSHQDLSPLAILPLIDYYISLPSLNDEIDRENVFKLSYKTHFYFLATDSFYSLSRWVETIRESTLNANRCDILASLLSYRL
ncbi:unnamed protein product [Dracunculus medinensis]|uniref:PH domain-containing protein n=1 Tax=Dracunculus medinensis TaxID=318479 RepID=A0A0N4U693_DRAME|nr:unnamed protein product [Dracunculus medinensis]